MKYLPILLFCSLMACSQKTKPAKDLSNYSTAYFASGCFWCVEEIFESVNGVAEVESGYAGGDEKNPTYEKVGANKTHHAEAVKVYYDPKVVSFNTLLDVYFGSQDPTTIGQYPDFGPQYRSIIFYSNPEEKKAIESKIKEVSKNYSKPIVTEVMPFEKFWIAEDYHQDYVKNNPYQPYVRSVSIPRLNEFKKKYPNLIKD